MGRVHKHGSYRRKKLNAEVMKMYINNPSLIFLRIGKNTFLKFISDEKYLKLAFRIKMGQKLDLDSPRSFNEKIQWLKIHDRNPLYTELADKYTVKKYISSLIGEEYIIPTIGVWDNYDDIDFDKLPNQFVLKCTHDSGGLVICRDKKDFDKYKARERIRNSLRRNFYWAGREWPYKNIKPRIIAEKYMEDGGRHGLRDYKFFCFSGIPRILYVSEGLENHMTARISFFDLEGNELPFHRNDYQPLGETLKLPSNFNEMLSISNTIAKNICNPFVRIDLYSINNQTFFSEVTFSPCGGLLPFEPKEWDIKLGEWINLDDL